MPTKRRNVAARDNTSVPQVVVDKIVPMTKQKLDETSRVLTYDKNGNPIRIARQNEAINLVSPEFDLLTLARGITNLPKGFLKTNKLPQGENLYYRQLNKNSRGLERAKRVGVIDTQSSGGRTFTTSRGTTFSIGKTFDTPFFAKGNLWYNNVDDMDVIVGKDNPVLDWKMITQHGRVTNNAAKAANRRTPFYNGDTNQAPTELFELYRRYPFIGYRNVTNGFPTVPITGLNTISENIDIKRCGGRRKAQLGLDIREGGIAIPIAKNMYYMQGRSHEAGGIGIGPNNKNGLEVEGGEVVKVGKDNIRVFSSVPFLRGASPAQLVMGGANPDTVFKAQENFKDRNRINDDGTKYETGGDKKTDSAIRTEDDKKVSRYKRAVYSLVDPTMPYPDNAQAVGYVLGAGLKTLTDPDGMLYTVNDSVSDAAWRKRLGLSYDDKFLVPNKDGSVRLPKSREKEIPVDTTMLKKRIAANTKLAERYPKYLQSGSLNEKREIVDWALRVDQEALDSLRHTYKTGEPVTINEGAYNSRQLIKDGELRWPEIMPHNVLQNYTIQYNPQTKQMEYKDVYDFNEFEWGVPGKPFDIKGSVPTKRYGGDDKSVYGSIKTKTQTTNDSKNGNTFRQISRNVMKNGLPFYQILESNDKGEMKKVFVQNPDSTYYSEQSGIRYKDNNPLNVHTFNYNTIPEDLRNYINILDNNNGSVKRYGGNMLYTINGNVKNGLMSLRRKALFGTEDNTTDVKEKRIGRGLKVGSDGLIYRQANSGLWLTDGSKYEDSQYYAKELEELFKASVNDDTYTPTEVYDEKGNRFIKGSKGWVKVSNEGAYRKRPGSTVTINNTSSSNVAVNDKNESEAEPISGSVETSSNTSSNKVVSKAASQSTSTPKSTSTPVVKTSKKEVSTTAPKSVESTPQTSTLSEEELDSIWETINKKAPDFSASTVKGYVDNVKSYLGLPKDEIKTVVPKTNETHPVDERWVGQYKPTTVGDWIGLGGNLIGSLASYIGTRNMVNNIPMPQKPVAAPIMKLKTRFNINAPLTEINEQEQMQRDMIGRNTSSSNVSLARQQRVMNEAQHSRNQLYIQKENTETQLINQDRLNRQTMMSRNVDAYNQWLNNFIQSKSNKAGLKASNFNNLISGLTGGIGDMLSRIENRRATNNTIQAIAAANPNVDARQVGNFDYYNVYDKKTGKFIRKTKRIE